MSLDVAGLQLHDFPQQFGFSSDVSVRALAKRPVEITVRIARIEPGGKSELVAGLRILIHVTKNARPIQVRDRQSGSDRNCGCRFRQSAVKVARVSKSDGKIDVRLAGLGNQPNHALEQVDGAGILTQPTFNLGIQIQDHRIRWSEFLSAIQDQFGFGELSCLKQLSTLIEEFARTRSPLPGGCRDRAQVQRAAYSHQCKNTRAIVLACSPCCWMNDGGTFVLQRVVTGPWPENSLCPPYCPHTKHAPSWFVHLQPGASLRCSVDHVIKARSAMASIRIQSKEHWTPPIRTRLHVERPR